jgi:two-component system sensor histidine kinase KdpD
MKLLVCNSGSSSLKFSLFEAQGEVLLGEGSIDWTAKPTRLVFRRPGQPDIREELELREHREAIGRFIEDLSAGLSTPLRGIADIAAVAQRVVHGGSRYKAAVRITPEVRATEAAAIGFSQQDLLEGFAREIAMAIDRHRLRDAEQRAKMLQESERLSKILLDSVSHEIRTPIAVITSAASMLKEAYDPSLTRVPWAMVDEIQEATLRLNRLVSNLLNLMRLESGHVKPNLDWCDVEDLIHGTLKEIEKDLACRKVTTEIAKNIPLVRLDFVLMQQVLTNLLLNAVVHTPPETSVQVRASAHDGMLTISVLDDGPGLPRHALPFVFDKFYRAPSARPGGTGLGLAIVKGLVEAQGGHVEAANRPEGGAAFRIRLPTLKSPPVLSEASY